MMLRYYDSAIFSRCRPYFPERKIVATSRKHLRGKLLVICKGDFTPRRLNGRSLGHSKFSSCAFCAFLKKGELRTRKWCVHFNSLCITCTLWSKTSLNSKKGKGIFFLFACYVTSFSVGTARRYEINITNNMICDIFFQRQCRRHNPRGSEPIRQMRVSGSRARHPHKFPRK